MLEHRTVLSVDDDVDILAGIAIRLKAAGYETLSASDGASGLALATEQLPDVILLDVRMPQKDGLDVLRELKQCAETKNIPVVMVSASLIDQQAAYDAGARYFLKKPYQPQMLLQAVTAALLFP
jgi:DNA-binding response OmpR family regulator